MNANTKTALWVLGAVLVIAVVYALVDSKPKSTDQANNNNGDQQQTTPGENQEQPGTDETPAATPSPTPAPARLTYNDALKTYGVNGYRFQFSDNCLGIPGRLTIKKGGKFMLDNRDDVAHTIKLGSQTFRLSKYGFAIVTASQTGDLDILCDGVTRAELLVQP
jgi:hypothetical protein